LLTDLLGTSYYQQGVASRNNALKAREEFAEAARWFDSYWYERREPNDWGKQVTTTAGKWPAFRTPGLALNRGHAHFLAGNVPKAILAFHEGLALFPYDAELQQSLAAARGTIPYPDAIDPAERIRPDPPRGVRNRVAPWDVLRFAAVCGGLLAVGLAGRLTTRPNWAGPVAALGGAGWLVTAGVLVAMHREKAADAAEPVAVVAADGVTLRKGNGESYPPRVEARLPRGAEVRVVGRRGGWVQVKLPGGAVGWLPEGVVLTSDNKTERG
jgi:hypothetical protein